MQPDVNVKDYYLSYITSAENSIKDYNEKLDVVKNKKENIINFIIEHKDIYDNILNIKLDNYTEWTNGKYNVDLILYNHTIKKFDICPNEYKSIVIQLIKYLQTLYEEYKLITLIDLANKRSKLKFSKFKEIIAEYYRQVHRCVLQGYGYKMTHSLGTWIINYWKLDRNHKNFKNKLDFAATNKRKKELLAKGCKLWNADEAKWYAEHNMPYDGVDYRIFQRQTYYYDITIIKSRYFTQKSLNYKRTEYVIKSLRGLSYQEIADKYCNNFDDIVNLNVDIKYKLNILLYKDPTKYLNFIRNADSNKYQRGTHNS